MVRDESNMYDISLEMDELGEKLGGGLPRGSIVLIEGSEGSGRSVLSQRLSFGAMTYGLETTFISTEMTMRDYIDQMYSLDYKIAKFLQRGKLLYIPVYPLIGQTGKRGDFLGRLMSSAPLYASDIIVIDSLSTLVDATLSKDSSLELLAFFKRMSNMGKTIIITIEEGNRDLDPFRLASDVYLSMSYRKVGGSVSRTINVRRYIRARDRVDDIIGFRVEPGIGLVVEITEVSG